jgi:hypothetical protein
VARRKRDSASRQTKLSAEHRAGLPDFRVLPEPVDPAELVETSDVDPSVHVPQSKFATDDIEAMARTGALGAGF